MEDVHDGICPIDDEDNLLPVESPVPEVYDVRIDGSHVVLHYKWNWRKKG